MNPAIHGVTFLFLCRPICTSCRSLPYGGDRLLAYVGVATGRGGEATMMPPESSFLDPSIHFVQDYSKIIYLYDIKTNRYKAY
jgi:hypothetical protein